MMNLEQFASQRLDHKRQRLALLEQQEQRLTVAVSGGLFLVNIQLLTFLRTETLKEIVILDNYDAPIKVSTKDLLSVCEERWQEVMNDWYNEYESLKKVRRIGQLNE